MRGGIMARKKEEDGYCILRTSGSSTMPLANSLCDAGFDVWTPVEVRSRLAGRNREMIEQDIAILPSYVFARLHHLAALLELSHAPSLNYRVWDKELRRMVVKGHPYFSVFHMHGQIRVLSERSLSALRSLEVSLQKAAERRREQEKQKGAPPQFKAGQTVRVDGGFEGLRMQVAEDNHGKTVKLVHPDWMWTVEISAWKLQGINVMHGLPEQGAALAA